MTDTRGPDVGARLDRLPPTRYIWYLVGLVSFGAFFEIYDLSLTAPLSLGLLVAGVFHRGAAGLFGITDQATFAAATFAGLYVGTHLGTDGWRWLAFVPAVGALLIWQVRRALPESPRWLEAHGRAVEADEITSKIEQRVARDLGHPVPPMHAATDAPIDGPTKDGPTKAISLWTPPYRRRTIVLIAFHLFQTIGYFGTGFPPCWCRRASTKQATGEQILSSLRRVIGGGIYVSEVVASNMIRRASAGGRRISADPIDRLTNRELQVLHLIGKRMSTRETARLLHLSVKTIESHRHRIKGKINLRSGTQLVQFAINWSVSENAGVLSGALTRLPPCE